MNKSVTMSYKNLLTTPTFAGDVVEVHTCMLQAGRRRSQPGGCLQVSFPATRPSKTAGKWPLSLLQPAFGLPKQQEKAAAELSEAACPAANWDRAHSQGEGWDLGALCLFARRCPVWIGSGQDVLCSKHRKRAEAGAAWRAGSRFKL